MRGEAEIEKIVKRSKMYERERIIIDTEGEQNERESRRYKQIYRENERKGGNSRKSKRKRIHNKRETKKYND